MIENHHDKERSRSWALPARPIRYNNASALIPRATYPWLAIVTCVILAAQPVSATLVVTYAESSGAVNSTLTHTSVINFSSLATSGAGAYSNLKWTDSTLGTVGTIDQVYLQKASQFGGANYPSGYYPVESQPSGGVGGAKAIPTTSLTLNVASSYFGLWWSAGDKYNTLTFYDGSTQVAQYTTATLPGLLPKSYYGNPVDGKADSSEPFAFLNFYGVGAQFNKVVLSNPNSTGFESDNWTVRSQAYGYYAGEDPANLPGILISSISTGGLPVPEPSSAMALGLSGLLLIGFLTSRRRVRKSARSIENQALILAPIYTYNHAHHKKERDYS